MYNKSCINTRLMRWFVHIVGWNDGSFNEFQTNWDEQIVIPGGTNPGGGNDYDKDPTGVTCYACTICQVEPFDAEASGVGTEGSCHVCSKEWDDGKWISLLRFISFMPPDRMNGGLLLVHPSSRIKCTIVKLSGVYSASVCCPSVC